jgi:hypothetical protein
LQANTPHGLQIEVLVTLEDDVDIGTSEAGGGFIERIAEIGTAAVLVKTAEADGDETLTRDEARRIAANFAKRAPSRTSLARRSDNRTSY